MRPAAGSVAGHAPPEHVDRSERTERIERIERIDRWLLTATALLYLLAGGATTIITWQLGYEDWFLYALMSLCTATVVTNYSILRPRAPLVLRVPVWAFGELVIAAWTLLLFERTQIGWQVAAGQAVDHGAQDWFYVPVAINTVCAIMLALHLVAVAPELRRTALKRG